MEDPNSEEAEMPIPLNSTYCHGHMTHHHHHLHHNHHPITGGPPQIPLEDEMRSHQSKAIRYRECLKNHAAAIGGNATDGCGEFMAAGSGGALACSACGCHRNFHRKETDDEHNNINYPRRVYLGQQHQHYQISYRPHHHHETTMTTGDEARAPVGVGNKKRFRTKFTQEQKEKMLGFAEKVGWKIQKQEESVVQRFCQEVGVKRRVLKVWMHNNKHTLANNKQSNNNNNNNNNTNSHHILNDHSNDINQVN